MKTVGHGLMREKLTDIIGCQSAPDELRFANHGIAKNGASSCRPSPLSSDPVFQPMQGPDGCPGCSHAEERLSNPTPTSGVDMHNQTGGEASFPPCR